jgi:glycosyltransferase involved in cell wall biosynthesis
VKVAFISYEYPPDTADGGIATYVEQAVRMLGERGHLVEVFAGSRARAGTFEQHGVRVHRILEREPTRFAEPAGTAFEERHRSVRFDVLEGPEYLADARAAVARVPGIPLVVKLHTPSRVLLRLNYYQRSFARRLQLYAWGLRHGHPVSWGYAPEIEGHRANVGRLDAIEREHARDADVIVTPSQSLGEMLRREWDLDAARIAPVPYPYAPARSLLDIPIAAHAKVVTFVGRLEVRKGVLDIAAAIPRVLREHPDAIFRWVGAADDSPVRGRSMRDHLEHALEPYRRSLEFTGAVSPDDIPRQLAAADVCVLPSLWENFPCACLEAMAAGRAIIASSNGGMREMLDDGRAGVVLAPGDARRLSTAISTLLADPARRRALGAAARHRLLTEYSPARIVGLQVASYARAIERRRSLGPRSRSIAGRV